MPGYKGHIAGGLAAYALVVMVMKQTPAWPTALEWLTCAVAGALFPDIDIKSKGQKIFYRVMVLLLIILAGHQRFELMAMISLIAMVPMVVRHRGLLHKMWFIIGFPSLIGYGVILHAPQYATMVTGDLFFFILGALSHLWLDLGLRRMVRW